MKRRGMDSVDSWIATFWCSFVCMILYGMVRLSGMLFVASMEEFHVDRERASFPYVLCDVTHAIMGPATGYFACKFGTRPVLMLGSLLAAIGIGANFFAESIETVTILWGVVFGGGFGFCCPILPIVITHHFVNKRATAIGIMYVGSYMGIAIIPSVLELLIENYGLKGTFLWLAGMVLHCFPALMLLPKPSSNKSSDESTNVNPITNQLYAVERYLTRKYSRDESYCGTRAGSVTAEFRKNMEHGNNPGIGNLAIIETNYEKYSVIPDFRENPNRKNKPPTNKHEIFPITSCNIQNKLTPSSCKVTFHGLIKKDCNPKKDSIMGSLKGRRLSLKKLKPSAAFKVFFEPIFILVLLSTAIFMCSFIAFMTIIVDFSKDIGLLFTDGKYIILGFSIASNVGLLSFGWVTDCGYLSVTNFSGIILLLRSITLAGIPFSNGFSMLLTIVMIQGLSEASIANLFPLIIAEYYSEDVHAVAISCSYVLSGPLHLAIPSLISFFRDGLGSYNYLFYSMGAASLLCSLLMFMAPLLAKCRCVKDEKILRNRSPPQFGPS